MLRSCPAALLLFQHPAILPRDDRLQRANGSSPLAAHKGCPPGMLALKQEEGGIKEEAGKRRGQNFETGDVLR
ncbi:hypothetical protein AOQ84DRAFT_357667 [Glonium stellatum]|uniref:Uncharacterized protein n=1 Tax=Glonium stellatum TaxID=574774 RepID=A0A8E2JM73_9PEZI|nr:hypothetical protein AOQ84DRAFT_357667 [Glonium stellatum]